MIVFQVADMRCDHCVSSITQAVQALDAHATVRADLRLQRVAIDSSNADPAALRVAIEEAGFTPVPAPASE